MSSSAIGLIESRNPSRLCVCLLRERCAPPAPSTDANAARDRDASNWTAWWSELNSNFGCGLKAALAQAAATYRISAIQARESADLLGG